MTTMVATAEVEVVILTKQTTVTKDAPELVELYTLEEVARHNTAADNWILLEKEVYNVTKFVDEHPGGKKIMMTVAGKDATKQFNKYHRPAILNKYKSALQVGILKSEEKEIKGFGRFFRKK